jgi:phage tail protein X
MTIVRANQGETLDHLCYRTIGRTAGVTEQVLELNPGLADLGSILPEGTPVTLPETPTEARRIDTVQLWK